MDSKARRVAILVLRLLLGGVLVYAGFTKLNDGYRFAENIANFRILPAIPSQILAVVLPWWELAAGLLLVFGVWTRPAALVSTVLFTAFGCAVLYALFYKLDIECGCFGTGSSHIGAKTVAIDAAGLAASVIIAWQTRTDGTKAADGAAEV